MTDALLAVLADVDEIPWADMTHCGGAASDIPGVLRAALLGSGQAQQDAASALYVLFYQGSSFEPTAHAGRYVVRAMPHLAPERRTWACRFVDALAGAYTMTEGQGTLLWVPEGDPERPAVLAQYEREKRWAIDARRAAFSAVPTLLPWLHETRDETSAIQLPYTLTRALCVGDEAVPTSEVEALARETVTALIARSERGDSSACEQAGLAFALGVFARGDARARERLRAMSSAGELPLLTAIALVHTRLDANDAAARAILVRALAERDAHAGWYVEPFPWVMGHLRFVLVRALASRETDDAAFAASVPAIEEVFRTHASSSTFRSEIAPVLSRALASPASEAATLPALLSALVETDAMWPTSFRDGTMALGLRDLGLPQTREGLAARIVGR